MISWHALSGSLTVFPGLTCVAPTAVTKGQVAGKPGLKILPPSEILPAQFGKNLSFDRTRDNTIWIQTLTLVPRNAIVTGTEQKGDTHETKLGIFTALAGRIKECQIGLVISVGGGDHVGKGFDGTTILLAFSRKRCQLKKREIRLF